MEKKINLPSNILIINPKQIIDVYIHPFVCKGNDSLQVDIHTTNNGYGLKFANKEDAKRSLSEIYSSMTSKQPLFIIRYHRGCNGEVIKSDEAVIGGMSLACIQKALENLKENK